MAGEHTHFPGRKAWRIQLGRNSYLQSELWKESRKKKTVETLEKNHQELCGYMCRDYLDGTSGRTWFICCGKYLLSISLTRRKPTSGSPSHLPSQLESDPIRSTNRPLSIRPNASSWSRGRVKGKWSGLDSSSDSTLGKQIVVTSTHNLDLDGWDHSSS